MLIVAYQVPQKSVRYSAEEEYEHMEEEFHHEHNEAGDHQHMRSGRTEHMKDQSRSKVIIFQIPFKNMVSVKAGGILVLISW